VDILFFSWFLSYQNETGMTGDVVELGSYKGKSAIHIGQFISASQKFIVCDLFDDIHSDESVLAQEKACYKSLTRESFEKNYLNFHSKLPLIVQGLTSSIGNHVEPHSCRFFHIDGSHMYSNVKGDAESAKNLLASAGVVAFDDYRSAHTPGVALAVWEKVLLDGLNPICLTPSKFYGTWGDPEPYRKLVLGKLAGRGDLTADHQVIARETPLITVLVATN
jgi:hypothetical protein